MTVSVVGFDATVIDYISIHGYQTYYGAGWYGPWGAPGGYCETVPTTTVVPQARQTDAFRHRAKDALEKAGYNIAGTKPDWVVEVTFQGPFTSGGDVALAWCWRIGTIFFCDYDTARWNAQLRIRDNRTGKLVHSQDYEQTYETHAFGLVPLFSILACDETSQAYIQMWCLTALTDRVLADATTFLAAH